MDEITVCNMKYVACVVTKQLIIKLSLNCTQRSLNFLAFLSPLFGI